MRKGFATASPRGYFARVHGEDDLEVVRRIDDAFNRRDREAMLSLWGEDAEWHPALLGGGILEGAVYRGHEGLIEFLGLQDDTWSRVSASPVSRTSGAVVERTTWTVWEVRAGKATFGRVFNREDEASPRPRAEFLELSANSSPERQGTRAGSRCCADGVACPFHE